MFQKIRAIWGIGVSGLFIFGNIGILLTHQNPWALLGMVICSITLYLSWSRLMELNSNSQVIVETAVEDEQDPEYWNKLARLQLQKLGDYKMSPEPGRPYFSFAKYHHGSYSLIG
jgi:hypothetical protein